MSRARFVSAIVLLLAGIGVAAPFLRGAAFAQDKGKVVHPLVKWEHKVVSLERDGKGQLLDARKIEEALNKLGADGWECVGTVNDVVGGSSAPARANVHLIWKRINAPAALAEAKPLLRIGGRYVFLSPAEMKRTAEVTEDLGGGWYKMKYKHSDGVERMIWLNLNQVVYFQPANE